MDGKKILLVGRKSGFLTVVGKELNQRFVVITASNEEEALKKVQADTTDIVVLGYLEPNGST